MVVPLENAGVSVLVYGGGAFKVFYSGADVGAKEVLVA